MTLTPAFDPNVTEYSATTSNASNSVTVTAEHEEALILIACGETAYESGDSITWTSGKNIVEVEVANGSDTKTYTVEVTKS